MNIVGFTLASSALLLLSDVAPKVAITVGAVIIVGYSLSNPQALNNLSSLFNGKTATK